MKHVEVEDCDFSHCAAASECVYRFTVYLYAVDTVNLMYRTTEKDHVHIGNHPLIK